MTLEVRIDRITYKSKDVTSFELVPIEGDTLPRFTAGAHIDVLLPNGLKRSYSLLNDPDEDFRYEFAVQIEPNSRGGSRYIHDHFKVGQILTICAPENNFVLQEGGSEYILIGGGIGVTPLISMAWRLKLVGANFSVHYGSRTRERQAFRKDVQTFSDYANVHIYLDDEAQMGKLDVAALLAIPRTSAHIYCCGPEGLLAAVKEASRDWPAGSVHFESFEPPQLASPTNGEIDFEVEVASTGQIVPVAASETILDALRRCNVAVESSCESGTCGTCMVRYLSGTPHHCDYILGDSEQQNFLIPCVSRAKSKRLVLDI